jgi:hypothetical protein
VRVLLVLKEKRISHNRRGEGGMLKQVCKRGEREERKGDRNGARVESCDMGKCKYGNCQG